MAEYPNEVVELLYEIYEILVEKFGGDTESAES